MLQDKDKTQFWYLADGIITKEKYRKIEISLLTQWMPFTISFFYHFSTKRKRKKTFFTNIRIFNNLAFRNCLRNKKSTESSKNVVKPFVTIFRSLHFQTMFHTNMCLLWMVCEISTAPRKNHHRSWLSQLMHDFKCATSTRIDRSKTPRSYIDSQQ